jgi:hypothetical protein
MADDSIPGGPYTAVTKMIREAHDPAEAEQRLFSELERGLRNYRYKYPDADQWQYGGLAAEWFWRGRRRLDGFDAIVLDGTMIWQLQIGSPITATPAKGPHPTDAPPPQPPERPSREKGKPYETEPRKRARAVLQRMFPDGYPSRKECPVADLLDRFDKEYARIEGKTATRYKPSKETIFRELGWRD